MLRKQLDEIEKLITETKAASQATKEPYKPKSLSSEASEDPYKKNSGVDTFNLPKKNILIIDDLGVITYQLSVMFEKMGYNTLQSKEIYDAIEKFKKQNFDLVIMDLFIPTEREGFILLEELKKTAQNKQKPTNIGVMSASGKKEHKQMCKIKGAEFYVEKIDDWQKELTAIVQALK
jgi:CheY-like chemotaxis protein